MLTLESTDVPLSTIPGFLANWPRVVYTWTPSSPATPSDSTLLSCTATLAAFFFSFKRLERSHFFSSHHGEDEKFDEGASLGKIESYTRPEFSSSPASS